MRVFLVDDDPAAVLLVELALRETGLDIDFSCRGGVRAGHQALLEAREQRRLPDVVLLDLNLPDGSGHELLELIKSQDELKELPVVVLSTSSYEPDVERAMASGAIAYNVKPSSFDELVGMMGRLPSYARAH